MLNISKVTRYGLQDLLYPARNIEKGYIKIEEILKKLKIQGG